MKKLLVIVLLLVISSVGLTQENYALSRARAALALSISNIQVVEPAVPATPIFPKNGYNPKTNIVWRETLPNDGQRWWRDPETNVFWRYLRQNENHETLMVPMIQGQFFAPAARQAANC